MLSFVHMISYFLFFRFKDTPWRSAVTYILWMLQLSFPSRWVFLDNALVHLFPCGVQVKGVFIGFVHLWPNNLIDTSEGSRSFFWFILPRFQRITTWKAERNSSPVHDSEQGCPHLISQDAGAQQDWGRAGLWPPGTPPYFDQLGPTYTPSMPVAGKYSLSMSLLGDISDSDHRLWLETNLPSLSLFKKSRL